MKKLILFSIFCFPIFLIAQTEAEHAINTFIDQWHQDAADVNQEAYFDKIDEDGIFIGTDASEIWSKQEFYDWAEPQFTGKGTAWDFKAIERNIYFGKNATYAWFDELLSFGNGGVLRGSGVLHQQDGEWTILHYVLSLPVPNDKFGDVMKVLKNNEQGTRNKE
jgi:hypothetical protein